MAIKPVAIDDVFNVSENDTIAGNILANDLAGDNGKKLLRAFDGVAVDAKAGTDQITDIAGTYGIFHVKADGSFTYTLSAASKAALNAGEVFTESLSYKISDGAGHTDTGHFTLNIGGVTDASVKPTAVDDHYTFSENDLIAGNVLDNDIPGSNGAEFLRFVSGTSIEAKDGPDHITAVTGDYGTFFFKPDGSFTYTLRDDVKASLGADQTISESLKYYKISDGAGHTDVGTLSLDISGEGVATVNHSPVAGADTLSSSEDGSATVTTAVLLANDTDSDGESLSLTSIDNTGTLGTVQLVGGDVTYTAGAAFQYLKPGETASDHFGYTVSDGHGGMTTGVVNVTISGANDAPVVADDSAFVTSGQSVVIDALANDSDPEGDTLIIGTIGSAGHGTVILNSDGTLTYTPDADFAGDDSFTYTAVDAFGAHSQGTVSLVVGISGHDTIGGDVFLQGNFMEIGVSASGSLGTASGAPEGYHPMFDGVSRQISYVVDPDGWNAGSPPSAGDFTLPGSPVDTIVLGINGVSYVQDERSGERAINTTTTDASTSTTLAALTTGAIAGAEFSQRIELDPDATYYKTTITITNTTSSDMSDVRFLRSFDPDQDIYFHGTYSTTNDVLSNPSDGNDIAVSRATGAISGVSVNLVAFDSDARASNYGFANYDAYAPQAFDAPVDENGKTADEAITLEFKIGTLAAGQTVTETFYTSLNGSANANDMRIGTDGNDTLDAGAGDDIVLGLAGNDFLTGGVGNDTFVFSKGCGVDTIMDFTAGAATDDVIELHGFGAAFDTFDEIRNASTETDGNVTINFGDGDSITLLHTTIASLSPDDFTFA